MQNRYKRYCTLVLALAGSLYSNGQSSLLSSGPTSFPVTSAWIYVDTTESPLVIKSAGLLQQDIEAVTGKRIPIIHSVDKPYKNIIAVGSERSALLQELVSKKKFDFSAVKNKWEAFQVKNIRSPFLKVDNILVLTGSDRRGVAYAATELSRQAGVSPWYWWADVPVKKKAELFIQTSANITDAPKVKYRGIFINDEAPCLSGWSKEKFGGFNHLFYAKVFELMLRLRANYLWPAMWGNAFYYDDSLNIRTADEYGIVIGTSHHEPLMRAHEEWKYFGKGRKWNYDSTEAGLKEFWKGGMQRAWNEKIVSIGMRGDGDEPMSRETATALLERIVKDQRQIIQDVTGKPASETPQLWALYKEVQDYYDKGMRVPDDVTLLLCDDNWGNIRKLPRLTDAPRKGGYGIYYHFDYVGGPRNYKWVNTNPIPRVWEQMHLAWEYGVKNIWIVNVGDIKPMEFPISFWCDYAWNPERIGADDLQQYTEQWAAEQFGPAYAKDIADIISKYGKYNGRRKPELLDEKTYSLAYYNEFRSVVSDHDDLLTKAARIDSLLDPASRDAYFQLVLHPVKACANLNRMYLNVALNNLYYHTVRNHLVNVFAEQASALYKQDSLITVAYHRLNNGKWNHLMDQTHIGYTYWQQPPVQKMPLIRYLPEDSVRKAEEDIITPVYKTSLASIPARAAKNVFFEQQLSGVSMEAAHFTRSVNTRGITWKVLPGLGRTGSAVTPFPVTAGEQKPGGNSPHLEYEFYTYSKDSLKLLAFFSPSLNFHNTAEGLQYAVSVDDETPQVISLNKEDKATGSGIWNKWVSENIIIKTTKHTIAKPGKHVLKYWMVNPGVVLQKLVIDFGELKPSYLGPPETRATKQER
ncbi:MAG: glycosyl hydrolase 115 family protein [Chitinophagaceae bacterium]